MMVVFDFYYVFFDGDVLDVIVVVYYGDIFDGKVEVVFVVNSGFLVLGVVLDVGVCIIFFDLSIIGLVEME